MCDTDCSRSWREMILKAECSQNYSHWPNLESRAFFGRNVPLTCWAFWYFKSANSSFTPLVWNLECSTKALNGVHASVWEFTSRKLGWPIAVGVVIKANRPSFRLPVSDKSWIYDVWQLASQKGLGVSPFRPQAERGYAQATLHRAVT